MEKKSKKWLKIIGLLSLGAFLVSVVAVGCGRSIHKHRDPEKIRKYVVWKVNDRLDDLDANDRQRKAIVGATEEILADIRMMKDKNEDKAGKLEIISELERGAPDSAEYHRLLDEKLDMFRDFAHRSLDRALKALMTLDTEQRKELLGDAREHVEEHHS